jgi:hypothetical protein
MSRALTKEDGALLKEAGEVFNETGCVPGIDGEQLPAERMVPDAKEYILETIDDPEAIYDPEIWDTPGFMLVLSWLAQKWLQRCHKLSPRSSKNPEQYLTKEQQTACLEIAPRPRERPRVGLVGGVGRMQNSTTPRPRPRSRRK